MSLKDHQYKSQREVLIIIHEEFVQSDISEEVPHLFLSLHLFPLTPWPPAGCGHLLLGHIWSKISLLLSNPPLTLLAEFIGLQAQYCFQPIHICRCLFIFFLVGLSSSSLSQNMFADDPDEGHKPKHVSQIKLFSLQMSAHTVWGFWSC